MKEAVTEWKDVLTDEKRKEIKKIILKKLDKAIDISQINPKGAPIWLNIMFLLDQFNSEDFYGTLSLRISGKCMENMKIESRTCIMNNIYSDIVDMLNS